MTPTKQQLLEALAAFIRQRPGLEFGNYGDVKAYRAEARSIARDKRDAETLLGAVAICDSITAEDLMRAADGAYSGRLQFRTEPKPDLWIEYTVGQYFPTEYRKAACAVLASALWEDARNKSVEHLAQGRGFAGGRGDLLRHYFCCVFGRSIGERWFN